MIKYEIMTENFEFRMGTRRDKIPPMSAGEIVDMHLSCDDRITCNYINPDRHESFADEAAARKFFGERYSNYGRTNITKNGANWLLSGQIAWLEANEYDENGEFNQGGEVLSYAAEPFLPDGYDISDADKLAVIQKAIGTDDINDGYVEAAEDAGYLTVNAGRDGHVCLWYLDGDGCEACLDLTSGRFLSDEAIEKNFD